VPRRGYHGAMNAPFATFVVAALLVTLAPGPDTFLVVSNTLAGGTRRGLITVFGIVAGGAFYVALFGLGVAPLLARSEAAFHAVKIAGAAYLAFLGACALRRAFRPRGGGSASSEPGRFPGSGAFGQGLLTNALNPKVAVFYLAFLPQFMRPGESMAAKAALLIGIHYAMGLVWLSLVVLMVSQLGAWLSRGPVRRGLDGVVGAAMLGFGVRMAFTSR